MPRFELPVPLSPAGLRRLITLGGTWGGTHRAPVPPLDLPEGRIVLLEDRGEAFVRDTGGDGPVILLLHGWMFPSDLNWAPMYEPLRRAGYRVLAMDLRGHGRGLRTPAAFRLADCADDAAGLLDALGIDRAVPVGYSMGARSPA